MRTEPDSRARYRSLLQKAVRRGNDNLVITTCALMESFGSQEVNWVRERAAVITFEECWPLGSELLFNKRFHSKVAALVRAARSVKAKDGCGLGLLAHALSEGDHSVLGFCPRERDLKILAQGSERPDDYWKWILGRASGQKAGDVVSRAHHFRNAGLPADRSIIRAGAFLAAHEEIPEVGPAGEGERAFPYWVALDLHTPEGRRTFRDISRDLHIAQGQLEWACYYFEGAVLNRMVSSPWWEAYCRWRFAKIELPADEAHLLWEPVRNQVIEALEEEGRLLHREIYQWKMAHLDRIRQLRQQVELFLEHFERMGQDQLEIF